MCITRKVNAQYYFDCRALLGILVAIIFAVLMTNPCNGFIASDSPVQISNTHITISIPKCGANAIPWNVLFGVKKSACRNQMFELFAAIA